MFFIIFGANSSLIFADGREPEPPYVEKYLSVAEDDMEAFRELGEDEHLRPVFSDDLIKPLLRLSKEPLLSPRAKDRLLEIFDFLLIEGVEQLNRLGLFADLIESYNQVARSQTDPWADVSLPEDQRVPIDSRFISAAEAIDELELAPSSISQLQFGSQLMSAFVRLRTQGKTLEIELLQQTQSLAREAASLIGESRGSWNLASLKSRISSMKTQTRELFREGKHIEARELAFRRLIYTRVASWFEDHPPTKESHSAQSADRIEEMLSTFSIELSFERMQSLIRSRSSRVRMNLPWGRAKINSVTNNEDRDLPIKFIQIRLNEGDRELLFLNIDKIRPDSKHLRKILSRIMVNEKRDPVVFWYRHASNGQQIHVVGVESFNRPEAHTSESRRIWWWATHHEFDGGSITTGLYCGTAQAMMALGMGALTIQSANPHGTDWNDVTHAAIWTFIYGGLVIGPTIKDWIEWETRGSRAQKIMKKFLKSSLFMYPLIWLFREDFSAVARHLDVLSESDPSALAAIGALSLAAAQALGQTLFDPSDHVLVQTRNWLNGFAKGYWQVFTEIGDEMGTSAELFKMPVLSKVPKFDVRIPGIQERPVAIDIGKWHQWKKRILFYNATEVGIAMPFSLLGVFGFTVAAPLIGNVDMGKILFAGSALLAVYTAKVLAEKYNLPSKPRYLEEWNRMKGRLEDIRDQAWAPLEDVILFPAHPIENSERLVRRGQALFEFSSWLASGLVDLSGRGIEWTGARIGEPLEKLGRWIQSLPRRDMYGQVLPSVAEDSFYPKRFGEIKNGLPKPRVDLWSKLIKPRLVAGSNVSRQAQKACEKFLRELGTQSPHEHRPPF